MRPQLVMDLHGVTFLDARGLGVLARMRRRVVDPEGRMAVVVTSPTVKRLLEVVRLDHAFTVFETVEEATARVSGPDLKRVDQNREAGRISD
jgi:anti-anti-sigma factor